jgi:putative flavoprotein involved in K+ transport
MRKRHGHPPHVAIIGAGPAGVAAAVSLARRGVGYTLLERGRRAYASLRRVDPAMRLLSPERLSRLPGMLAAPAGDTYPTFEAYLARLEAYLASNGVRPVLDTEVIQTRRADGRFLLDLRGPGGTPRTLEASHVINATGIITTPRLPDTFDPGRAAIPWKHSLDVRGSDLAAARHLLVVGGGASAAEVLDRWLEVREPGSMAWLSLRSRLRAFVNPILGLDVHYWVWLPERLPTRWLGWRAGRMREPMNGTRVLPAITEGSIRVVPEVAQYRAGDVVLGPGDRLTPDLIVFATGMRYATAHLETLLSYDPDGRPLVCCCESRRTPGLYLLGFKFGRTFASPYLRGIGRDAAYVASRIGQG